MISRLKGRVEDMGDTWVVLDVNGVGYQAFCSRHTLTHLGALGDHATLYIETVLRQDSLQLYGFGTQEEKNMFLFLTTVQGVGMRVGLAILSALTPDQVVHAIASQDKTMVARAEGVGPKLAGRIIAELKDKVSKMGTTPVSEAQGLSTPPVTELPGTAHQEEAVSALVNLGYRRSEAIQAVSAAFQKIGTSAELNDLIRAGLSSLGRAS